MSKLVFFSDTHVHPFKAYSSLLDSGLNSRLQDSINAMNEVFAYAEEIEADAVFFGGDLFHERRHIVTQAFNAAYSCVASFVVRSGIPVYMIDGNHDQADRGGEIHALETFKSCVTVIDRPEVSIVRGKTGQYCLTSLPYIEEAVEFDKAIDACLTNLKTLGSKDLPNIFLGHFGVNGANLGSDFVYVNGHEPSIGDLPTSEYDVGFLGHFHMHQKLTDNFYYIGATLQHNWGDRGQARGFVVYDTETGEIEHKETSAPKFILLNSEEELVAQAPNLKDQFVRFVSSRPNIEIPEFKSLNGLTSLEAIAPDHSDDEAFEARIDLSPSLSYLEMVRKYVGSDLVDLEGMDEDYLVSVANDIITTVID